MAVRLIKTRLFFKFVKVTISGPAIGGQLTFLAPRVITHCRRVSAINYKIEETLPMSNGNMSPEDYLQLSSVYSLLSRLWLSEVDLQLLTALNEPDMRDAYVKMGGQLPEGISDDVVEELAVDYCQLLIGPKYHISPVQSVWQENKLQGSAASSMSRYFEAIPTFDSPSTIVDHVGVQLAFIAELFLQASASDNPEAHEEIASQFFVDHVAWTTPFFDKVEGQATTSFYKGLANISREFLAFEPEEEIAE